MTTSSSSSTSATSSSTDNFSASDWTQHNMFSDLMQQKGLLIGLGVAAVVLFLLKSRSRPEEKAARRLVRDVRRIDDVDDLRELLGDNVPTIVRPALLMALAEVERQVHRGFRKLEREIAQL